MSDRGKYSWVICLCAALTGCGQTGKLYLPGTSGEVTTRSTQTPPEPATPAPETTAPEGDAENKDEKGKKNPPPDPQKN